MTKLSRLGNLTCLGGRACVSAKYRNNLFLDGIIVMILPRKKVTVKKLWLMNPLPAKNEYNRFKYVLLDDQPLLLNPKIDNFMK